MYSLSACIGLFCDVMFLFPPVGTGLGVGIVFSVVFFKRKYFTHLLVWVCVYTLMILAG